MLLSCLFLYHYVRGMQNCDREPLYHLLLPPVKAAFPSKQFTWFSDLSVTRLLQITYYQEARTQALVFSIGISWQGKKTYCKDAVRGRKKKKKKEGLRGFFFAESSMFNGLPLSCFLLFFRYVVQPCQRLHSLH